MHTLGRSLSCINTPCQRSCRCIIRGNASLIVAVFILAVAVIKARCPLAIEMIFCVELRQIGLTICNIKRFVKTYFSINVYGLFRRKVENRSTIERSFIVPMGIEHGYCCIITKPGE